MTRVNGNDGLTCSMPIRDLAVHWDRDRALALLKLSRRTAPTTSRSASAPRQDYQVTIEHRLRDPQLDRRRRRHRHPDAEPPGRAELVHRDDGQRARAVLPRRRDATTSSARSSSPAPAAPSAPAWTSPPTGNVFGLDESRSPTPADLRDRLDDEPFHAGVRDTGGKVTLAIHDCPKPVIAAINGAAVGIGATMTLAMDIRLASTKARIGFVFGRLGIVPEAASTWFLPRIVGIQQALEWVYSAEILTAEQALAGRLVRSVHEPEDLLDAAYELARTFVVGRSPVALGLAKQMLYRNSAADHPIEAHRADSLAMWHASRRRQGGRRRLPREARPGVHRPGERAARDLLTATSGTACTSRIVGTSRAGCIRRPGPSLGRCADHVRATHRVTVGVGDRRQPFERWREGERGALDDLVRLLSPMLWQVVARQRPRPRPPPRTSSRRPGSTLVARASRSPSPAPSLAGCAPRPAVRRGGSPSRPPGSTRSEDERSPQASRRAGAGGQVVLDDDNARLWALPRPAARALPAAAADRGRRGPARLHRVASHLGMPVGSIGPTRGRCLDKLRHELALAGGR